MVASICAILQLLLLFLLVVRKTFLKSLEFLSQKTALNPLTPELNPSAQRCLTSFLLVILLLESCISLIYA
jgi:hypothetical protein